MADPVSLSTVVVGGCFTVLAAVGGGVVGRWKGKRQAGADIAKTVTDAAQSAVHTLTEIVEHLRTEVERMKAAHQDCETGRAKDRAECADEIAALRTELRERIPALTVPALIRSAQPRENDEDDS